MQSSLVPLPDCLAVLSQIPGHDFLQEINMEITHLRQSEATQGQTEKMLLAHWPSLQPKHAEQNYAL